MRVSFPNCDGFDLDRNVLVCGGELAIEPSYTGIARLRRNVFFSRTGICRWVFHDRLPSLERNPGATPALPLNVGSIRVDPGCRFAGGRVSYADTALAVRLGLRELDVSRAGCGRGPPLSIPAQSDPAHIAGRDIADGELAPVDVE